MEPVKTGQQGKIYSLGPQKKKLIFNSIQVKDFQMKTKN